MKVGLNISDGIMQRERQPGNTLEVLGLGDKMSNTQIGHTLVPLKLAYIDQESERSFLELFQRPNLKAIITAGGLTKAAVTTSAITAAIDETSA